MNKNKRKILSLLVLLALTWVLIYPTVLLAEIQVTNNKYFNLKLDEYTISKGYTVSAFAGQIKLSLKPGILSAATEVEVLELDEKLEIPWELDKISDFFQFEFKNKNAYDKHTPFYIQINYNRKDNNLKQVFYFDKGFNSWRPLPTKDFPKNNYVRTLIHLPYARLAVFSYPNILSSGQATWYKYKTGLFAASPDFPKGTKLKIYNLDNNKSVEVVVNDYGPDRKLFKNRVLDLEKEAFTKIASLSSGLANIYIEPLSIPPDKTGLIMGIPADGLKTVFNTVSKSSVVMDETTGEIIWSKNSTTTLPLASLTKLVAVKTFFDTKPTLNQIVSYSFNDENYNYKYCQPWESAKLNVKDGEAMSIEDLIYASLVGSANNTIETLVRVSGMPRDDFISRMNKNVVDWGASTTHFTEPTGLSPANVSSASDYAIITKEVFKNPIIEKASKMSQYIFYTRNTNVKHKISNTNDLIRLNKYNITGSKTGYLDEAGYCLMTRVKSNDGRNLIVVVMGSATRDESFTETEKLINYSLRVDNTIT